jgi:hypothetical protein
MRLVILESPYAAATALQRRRNVTYARHAMRDSFNRGEAPFASHLLYTQPGVLDDDKPNERMLGIQAGWEWALRAECTVVYTDFGISEGMSRGIKHAQAANRPVEYRKLNDLGISKK